MAEIHRRHRRQVIMPEPRGLGSGGGGAYNPDAPSFVLPFNDRGAGIVNLLPSFGNGSPTFTRATVAWTKLSTGLWAQIASGQARSSYIGRDTAVGAYGGFFAEVAGIQLVTPTASIRDMTDASWVKVTMTAAKTSIGIDGAANSATRLTATGATSTILQTLVAAATDRTYSCWMRRVTGSGAISIQQGATTLDVTASLNTSTYTLVQLGASVLNSAFGITIATSADAIDVDFNQFEAGLAASSPMDAAGAARNADVLTYPITGNALSTAGTAYAELYAFGDTAPFLNRMLDITDSNGQALSFGPTSLVSYDGLNQNTKAGLASVATGIRKRATSWGAAGMSATGDGAAPATSVFDGVMGAGGGNIIIGPSAYCIGKNIQLWTMQRSDVSITAMTA